MSDTIFSLFWFEFYCCDSAAPHSAVQTTREKQQCLALPAIVDTFIPYSRFKARGMREMGIFPLKVTKKHTPIPEHD
ncbi:hypothetical protein [Methanoregula formicica]|uniref:hypothetical protein n=1 Tax=Methanoregula formicica TaxID=882104 RepID=UPI0011D1ACEF|nr:hypothetical protein [Methanoregula formicica]